MADTKTNENKHQFVSMSHKSPTSYTAALKGVNFPCSVAQLVETAKQNHADEMIIERIGRLPEGDYKAMIDVTYNLGNVI